jgi:Tol biopolymer transport system component
MNRELFMTIANRRRAAMVLLGLVLLAFGPRDAAAQYSGYFGQNKIAYDKFRWKVYKAPHFDIYYYPESEPFLDDIVSYAESAYVRLSKELDHELRFRIPMVVYKTHGEFEETNITLEELPEEVGAFAEPIQNRMVLPIDQPPDKLYKLISHELTHIFQYSLFFEGYLGRALRARIPTWLVEGMASYFGQDEDSLDRMFIRDAVVTNGVPPIQQLDSLSYMNYRYGHAVFDYIEQDFGKEGVRNFVYEFRKVLLTGNIEKAIKEAFGMDIEAFNRNFNRFLRQKYFPVLLQKKSPDDYGKEIGIHRPGVFTFSPTISPSGELIAALASPKMEIDLVVLSAEEGKKVKNLTKGWSNKYRWLVSEAFSGRRDLSWSATGDQIAVMVRKENRRELALYDSLHGKLDRLIPLPGIAQAASPAFSPDGTRVAFEGNKNGVVDIFEIDLGTKAIRNLTQDDDYDGNPWYAADGTTLLYNRRIGESWKIFSVDLSDPTRKTQLTFGPSLDIQPSYSRDGKSVFFSSDRGGFNVFNIFALDLASGETRQYTDVVAGCFSPVEMAPRGGDPYLAFAAYFDGTFRLYRMPLKQSETHPAAETAPAAAPEAGPFVPPLTLKADTATAKPYKLRWDLEAPSISVGLADDGTFLSNIGLQFADLLGDHRIGIQFYSVADFSNFLFSYTNVKHRAAMGVSVFDLRDYYLSSDGFNVSRRQAQRNTGVQFFVQYPFNRYYRLDAGITATDSSQDIFVGYDVNFAPQFVATSDRFLLFQPSLVGDTTRFQSFGPFQGKRFELGATYGLNLGGTTPGNVNEYHLDFRAYKQLTRRSTLAFRAFGAINKGERQIFYGVGGLNTLRGYDFRAFYGSNVAEANLELRFPFVDEMRFPFGPIRNIRGFLFLDAGTAWLPGDQFYDPDLFAVRVQPNFDSLGNVTSYTNIPFSWWDRKNDRLQDLRASWGAGFQFYFIGGVQFNWAWAKRLPYTQYIDDPTTPFVYDLIPVKADVGKVRTEFYITFDW